MSRLAPVLITLLVMSSLASPVAATTAAESQPQIDGTYDGVCDSAFRYTLPVSCALGWDDPIEPSGGEVDMHVMATSERESYQSHHINMENYLEDTSTIASLEARHAIATAYEQGNTSVKADRMARDAVRNYYSIQQKNHLEIYSKVMTQFDYIDNVSNTDDEVAEDWFTISMRDWESTGPSDTKPVALFGEFDDRQNLSVDLLNGSVENVETGSFSSDRETCYSCSNSGEIVRSNNSMIDPFAWNYDESTDEFKIQLDSMDGYEDPPIVYSAGKVIIPNVGNASEDGLESARVWDMREWWDVWTSIEDQSNSIVQNYPTGFSDDIYDRLDSGDLSVEDLRGAEGTVRYMAGGDSATEGSLQLALQHTLGTSNPDMSNVSSMQIDYSGYTDYSLEDHNGSRVSNYSDHVDQTFEGLLFSSSVPDSGQFETGVEYNTSVLGGSQMVLTSDGQRVQFEKGSFTITQMKDPNGNEVDNASYTAPEYDNYDAQSWVDYIDSAEDTREVIVEKEGSGGWGLPSFGGLGGNSLVGIAVIGVAALVVVGFVTNRIPGLGE